MKYTLVVGIAYKKYKNASGDIAVYVGGRLIDAFQIDQDVTFVCEDTVPSLLDETWYRRLGRIEWWLAELGTKRINGNLMTCEIVPKLFKIYEIEEQDLNGLVEIKVDNSHNDYNNGFMKNNSMIRFPMIGLFPSHFAENRGEQLMRIMERIYSDKQSKHGKKSEWPCVGSFYTKRQNNMHEKAKVASSYWWIGGSFTAEIPIKTKHRIRYLSSIGAKGTGFLYRTPMSMILATCKPLLNIYNEDQRSNNTED
jgi:hypothetical protein